MVAVVLTPVRARLQQAPGIGGFHGSSSFRPSRRPSTRKKGGSRASWSLDVAGHEVPGSRISVFDAMFHGRRMVREK
jgi:hypothetical protein